MPYIPSKEERKFLDGLVDRFLEANMHGVGTEINYTGKLNYFLFKLCKEVCRYPSYKRYRNFIGELESAKLEIYRRLVAPHEDDKIIENGDVTIRKSILGCTCKNCGREMSEREYTARDGICQSCWVQYDGDAE